MFEAPGAGMGRWPAATVGKLIGSAFGFGLAVILTMRATWAHYLLAFSPVLTPIPFLSIFATAALIGAFVGARLAKANFVPPLAPATALAIAVLVAFGPLTAGYLEVFMRGAPLALPTSARVIGWNREPWGDRLILLESHEEVDALQEELVRSAEEAGWHCIYCRYQPSTRTGHASFRRLDTSLWGAGGRLGFEIWPGDMALYGTKPSTLTQVRMAHEQRTWSVEWTTLLLSFVLLAGMIRHSGRQRGG